MVFDGPGVGSSRNCYGGDDDVMMIGDVMMMTMTIRRPPGRGVLVVARTRLAPLRTDTLGVSDYQEICSQGPLLPRMLRNIASIAA